jgi:hypothetical protein
VYPGDNEGKDRQDSKSERNGEEEHEMVKDVDWSCIDKMVDMNETRSWAH